MSVFLRKAIVLNLASSAISFGFLFLNFILLTRYLGTEGFYIYTVYFTLAGVFSLANFSFQHIFVNFEEDLQNIVILSSICFIAW